MSTPTIIAGIVAGDLEGVRRLLDSDPGVVHRREGDSEDEWTTLVMNATPKEDCCQVTELLLQAGADISTVDAQGRTGLDYAAHYGLRRVAEVLRRARSC